MVCSANLIVDLGNGTVKFKSRDKKENLKVLLKELMN